MSLGEFHPSANLGPEHVTRAGSCEPQALAVGRSALPEATRRKKARSRLAGSADEEVEW
jgi:hypothetical protein